MKRWITTFTQRRLRDRKFFIRMGQIVGFLLLVTLMAPRAYRLNLQYVVGQPWRHKTLKAPFEFSIYRSAAEIEQEKERVRASIPRIFVPDSTNIQYSNRVLLNRMQSFVVRLKQYQEAKREKESKKANTINEQYLAGQFPGLNPDAFPSVDGYKIKLASQIRQLIADAYDPGYLTIPVDSIGNFIQVLTRAAEEQRVGRDELLVQATELDKWLAEKLARDDPAAAFLRKTFQEDLKSNLVYDPARTQKARASQVSLVSPTEGRVKENELIVSKGSEISAETARKIESLIAEQRLREGDASGFLLFLSQFLVITLITALLLVYLAVNRPRIYFDNTKLALVLFTFLITL
ncbi:MAG: hypothetical protein AAF206_19110, partial [Bacteroidota bacterium]